MVSQSFHIPYDFGTYLLTCGLLILPVIYILDAASPLIIYYYTIINWGALEACPEMAVPFSIVFGRCLVRVYKQKAAGQLSYIMGKCWSGFCSRVDFKRRPRHKRSFDDFSIFFLLVSAGYLPKDIKGPLRRWYHWCLDNTYDFNIPLHLGICKHC